MITEGMIREILTSVDAVPHTPGTAGYQLTYLTDPDDIAFYSGATVIVRYMGSGGVDEDGWPVNADGSEFDPSARGDADGAWRDAIASRKGYTIIEFTTPEMAWVPIEFGVR
jgi:hypothetical protein